MTEELKSEKQEVVSIGRDVHRGFYVVSGVSGGVLQKRCRIPARGEAVVQFVRK